MKTPCRSEKTEVASPFVLELRVSGRTEEDSLVDFVVGDLVSDLGPFFLDLN